MIKKIKNISAGMKLLSVMTIIYLLVAVINHDFFVMIVGNLYRNLTEVVPILVLVFFIIFLINYFIKPEAIKRHLGKESGVKGWIYVLLGSFFIAGPPYVILPILKEIRSHGMRYSLLALFMNNRNVQPTLLPVMAYYFGWTFTAVVSFYIIFFAILSAIIIGKIMGEYLESI